MNLHKERLEALENPEQQPKFKGAILKKSGLCVTIWVGPGSKRESRDSEKRKTGRSKVIAAPLRIAMLSEGSWTKMGKLR